MIIISDTQQFPIANAGSSPPAVDTSITAPLKRSGARGGAEVKGMMVITLAFLVDM